MENEELKKFLKENHGYITTTELERIGISKPMIPRLINKKILRKVNRGIYIDNSLFEDEFFILQKRFSNIVFSYNTACYLLGLSDRAPYKLEITTINHNNINANIDIHYVCREKFDIGIIEIESPYTNPIKVYNAERCICDILKNPNSVDSEMYNKIINNYFKKKNKNLTLLEEYSKIFNVYEKFINIMEVLI
ncbi:MAG: type IV toxin-antitoxin system AbiEi family antitoxin domain-containing protein [Clostridia bacterium]|nr:type IV toxin-antitoxin system AbiEi family antitoxin domain-containing protein [Clostridia bacterium]